MLSALINKYLVRRLASLSHQRYIAQLSFHHPLKVAVQETIDEEDVEGALMIRHEHIALAFLQVLPTLYLDGQEEDSDPQL